MSQEKKKKNHFIAIQLFNDFLSFSTPFFPILCAKLQVLERVRV